MKRSHWNHDPLPHCWSGSTSIPFPFPSLSSPSHTVTSIRFNDLPSLNKNGQLFNSFYFSANGIQRNPKNWPAILIPFPYCPRGGQQTALPTPLESTAICAPCSFCFTCSPPPPAALPCLLLFFFPFPPFLLDLDDKVEKS